MSKALGHALEGMVKGLVQHLCDKHSKPRGKQYEVGRKLPIALTMNCDIVAWEKSRSSQNVLANVLVFHCFHKPSSEKKWKRSRQEYIESELLPRKNKKHKLFNSNYHTGMVIFCPFWKDELIADFQNNLTPCLYVPGILTADEERKLCAGVEKLYAKLNQDTEGVAEAVRKNPGCVPSAKKILSDLDHLIFGYKRRGYSKVIENEWNRLLTAKVATDVPDPFSTRFSHGINLLALFAPSERKILYDFHERGGGVDLGKLAPNETRVVLKALFLGVATLRRQGKGDLCRIIFQSKVAVDDLDVAFVLDRLDLSVVDGILGNLMGYASAYPKPYAGFVSGLRMANCTDLIPKAKSFLKKLKGFLSGKVNLSDMRSMLRDETTICSPSNLWKGAVEPILAVWSVSVSLLVAITKDRSHTKIFGFKRTDSPTPKEASEMAKAFKLTDATMRNAMIEEALVWIDAWEKRDWGILSAQPVPALFSIKEPSSWLQWHYNIIGTHSVFSAVSEVCYRTIALKDFTEDEISGFPQKRSESVSKVIPGSDSRAQLAMAAKKDSKVVIYEGKCVTANHIGDKSKELFDRIGDFKRACATADLEGEAVLVLDGDFSKEALEELSSAEAYDRIYSMDELLPAKGGS